MENNNPNMTTSKSQARRILEYMRQGNTITPAEARKLFGCDRLSGRIMDIERMVGYKPPRKLIEVNGFDADGHAMKKRVMSYWLEQEN